MNNPRLLSRVWYFIFFRMALQRDWFRGIQQVMNVLPAKTVKRGRGYFREGHVLSLNCVVPEIYYKAVVRGGEDYRVDLRFDGQWEMDCSCPMGVDCKHGVAALLKLQAQTIGMEVSPDAPSTLAVFPGPKTPKSQPALPPPDSPLQKRLAEKSGGKLNRAETAFIRKVQACWNMARHGNLIERDFLNMASDEPVSYGYWQRVSLWPQPPGDDFYFWLYAAWELRRRNIGWPSFMDKITDLALIEPAMREWEHAKEVQRWKNWFAITKVTPPPPESPGILEVRLVIFPDQARLQWRTDPAAAFADFKQGQGKKLGARFEDGSLPISPECISLWSAAYKPWSFESWWIFRYNNLNALSTLGQLLRMPLPAHQVVTSEGKPFPRDNPPLRLTLEPPPEGSRDYRLALTTQDGAPPPPTFAVIPGHTVLYITSEGVFPGPSTTALGNDPQQIIPAEAIETNEGLRFLHSGGVALPPKLQERVVTVSVGVTIKCDLRNTYPGSSHEDIVIQITSTAPGMPKEKFTPNGWEPVANPSPGAAKKSAKERLVIHDRRVQNRFPRAVEALGAKWNGYPGDWRLRLTKKTPEVFVSWLKSLPPEIEVLLSKELATLRDEPISGSVELDIVESGIDWFDVRVKLDVGETTLTPQEIELLLNARGGYVRLGKKGWRRLQYNLSSEEDEQLARLGLHARDFTAEPQRFHALQLADKSARKFLGPEHAEKIERRVGELKVRVSPPLPAGVLATLRPYQMEGFHFLAYLTANRFGGVLADDMGLGKTLQTLAWLAWLRETASPQPALVVCPKSVTDNWRAEAERFYPGLRVRLWRGEPASELDAARAGTDLLVMNYAQLRALSPKISDLSWQAVILDEAQYIKNPDSQTAQVARALKSEHRLALTGTPIENRLLDLWSIFSFTMPGVLGNRAQFLRRFDAKDDPLARRRLAARVRPFLLRRTKTQVAKDLPDRVEEDLFCELEAEQKVLYRAELKRARQLVLGLQTAKQLNEQRFNILTSLLRLRQICCHPLLVDNTLEEADAAKVLALEDLLEPLMAEGHKVLVFSQFVSMLGILRKTLEQRGWNHFYLAGDTENRGDLVRDFQSASGGSVFLISLKAGGFGLNLTAASYVILFDPWWNPAVENQAIDRTHRIGQTRKVMAYRLLMRDTIEQKIRLLQKQKAALADDVFGEERFAQSLTLDDLRFLFSD